MHSRIRRAVSVLTAAFVLAAAVVVGAPVLAPASAAPAPIEVYPLAGVYPPSSDYTLTVNGQTVPVQDYGEYDIAQLAMGTGTATVAVTKTNGTTIGSYGISPLKLGLTGAISGPTLTFTVPNDEYLIIKVDGRAKLVLAIDPLETNRPAASGTGVFNVQSAPYSAVPGTAYSTTGFQNALNDAAAWGSANGGKGTVYVPAGVYTLGTLYLRSNLALYLAPGAVLRYTGERAHNDVHWHKDSQNRDVSWFISTRYSSSNISISGRGIIDGNGRASLQPDNIGVNLLVPIYTDNFSVTGITFRESSSWAVMPTRSTNLQFRDIKIFNRFDMGENDGIDVMESTGVYVKHAIGIGLDDPFSTKTWANHIDLFESVPGNPRPLGTVTFEDLVSWTYCYGVKVGQGVLQPQSDVTFKQVVVYAASIGIGIHHKYGTGAATNVRFEDFDIESVPTSNDGNRTWLALWSGSGPEGIGPVTGVTIQDIRVRDAGTTAARITGVPGAPITTVALIRVRMPGATSNATTLAQLGITNVSDASGITVTP